LSPLTKKAGREKEGAEKYSKTRGACANPKRGYILHTTKKPLPLPSIRLKVGSGRIGGKNTGQRSNTLFRHHISKR